MLQQDLFHPTEHRLIHLVNLWNIAEADPAVYEELFVSNPHQLADIIRQGTSYDDW